MCVYMSISGTLYARSFCRCRRYTLHIETTWIMNRYFCFQKIEKPQILVLKKSPFSNQKITKSPLNENQRNFRPTISCETTVYIIHLKKCVFNSTGRRPASYCHGVVTSCVRPSVRASVNFFFKKLLRNY